MDDTVDIKPPECSCFQDTKLPRGLDIFSFFFFLSSSGYLIFDAQDSLSLNIEKLRGEKQRINRNGICIPNCVDRRVK